MRWWLCSDNGVEQSLKTLQGCTVFEGHGRFVTQKKVAVNGSELAADQIFIDVGRRAAHFRRYLALTRFRT